MDQGLPRSGDLLNKFAGLISRISRQNLPNETRREVLQRHNIYVSLSQSSEWGMRSLHGTFTRNKRRMTSIKRKRILILSVVVLLHNFCTEVVGWNQLVTVFNVEYESFVNIRNYDRISQLRSFVVDSDDE